MKTSFLVLSLLFVITACDQSKITAPTAEATPTPAPVLCTTECRIFLTQTATNAAFGGAAGADTICANDAHKPTTGTYKAIIMDNTRNQTTNWVLKANTTYYHLDKTTPIGTTNSHRIFAITNGSHIVNSTSMTDFEYTWTGIYAYDDQTWNLDGTCSNWTNSSNVVDGMVGDTVSTDMVAMTSNLNRCDDVSIRLLCVEQ